MRTPVYTKQFSRDVKRMEKRAKKLKLIARTLIAGEPLDPLQRDRKLVGSFSGRRECHIEADWLLIYKIEGKAVVFERTGTHSDLSRC